MCIRDRGSTYTIQMGWVVDPGDHGKQTCLRRWEKEGCNVMSITTEAGGVHDVRDGSNCTRITVDGMIKQ